MVQQRAVFIVVCKVLTTINVMVVSASSAPNQVVDRHKDENRFDAPHSKLEQQTQIPFLFDALQSAQESIDEPNRQRALSFVARLRPRGVQSELEFKRRNK